MLKDKATWQPALGRTICFRSRFFYVLVNILVGARSVCFTQLSESVSPLGAGMAPERYLLDQLFSFYTISGGAHCTCIFCKVDMYAVESHRFAESWIFAATNDSVVRKANCFSIVLL